MNLIQRFFLFTLVTGVVFSTAALLFAEHLVFGNILASPVQALLASSLIVGFVSAFVDEIVIKIKEPRNIQLFVHWVANTIAIYFLARTELSDYFAIGIKSYWVALILGVLVNLAQYAVLKTASKK